MTEPCTYVFNSAEECDRLERQALLQGSDTVLRHIPLCPGARILDAGSGSGFMARKLAARDPQGSVVGIDLSGDFVTYAQRRAADEGLANVSFRQGDLQALPFEAASFDIVWSHLVLFFVPRPEVAIAEFRRVLKPGGKLIVALHERTLMDNYPEDPILQPQIERVISGFADVLLAHKLPPMLQAAGFADLAVSAEMDRTYTKIGIFPPQQRRNFVEVIASGMHRIAQTLGGQKAAEEYFAGWLAYLDRSDTYSYTTLWVVQGTVPA